jgi:ribonuclease P protein component
MISCKAPETLPYPLQAMFVVPKRNFKRSPDRNLLRRRIKECYRITKESWYKELTEKNSRFLIAFLYISKKEEDFGKIDSSVRKLMNDLLAHN